MNLQYPLEPRAGVRSGLRRVEGPRPDLGARSQPARGQPRRPEPAAEPALCRHHLHRVARLVGVQRAAGEVPAADGRRPDGAGQLHLRQVDRRRVGILHEHGRPQLPAEQSRPRRRAGPIELRRAAPPRREPRVRSAVQRQRLVDDWQLQAVGTWETGRPFTVAIHPDIDVSNTGRSNLGFGYNDRPNVSGDPALSESDRTETQWFKTSAYSFPAFGTFGNSGRNTLSGPGYRNVNLAVIKAIPVGARAHPGALRGVQPVQHHQPGSARRVPRLADLRTGPVGRPAAPDPARDAGAVLSSARGFRCHAAIMRLRRASLRQERRHDDTTTRRCEFLLGTLPRCRRRASRGRK